MSIQKKIQKLILSDQSLRKSRTNKPVKPVILRQTREEKT